MLPVSSVQIDLGWSVNEQKEDSHLDRIEKYFAAWDAQDAAALAALFTPDGSYCDPMTPRALRGLAIADYANELWDAFPDLSFDRRATLFAEDGPAAAQWILRGTNQGSLLGLPPTGYTISLPGITMLKMAGKQIHSARSYFDSRTFARQLGLQMVV